MSVPIELCACRLQQLGKPKTCFIQNKDKYYIMQYTHYEA